MIQPEQSTSQKQPLMRNDLYANEVYEEATPSATRSKTSLSVLFIVGAVCVVAIVTVNAVLTTPKNSENGVAVDLAAAAKSEMTEECQVALSIGQASEGSTIEDGILCRTAYVIGYNFEHHVAKWVQYRITKTDMEKPQIPRKTCKGCSFHLDPDLKKEHIDTPSDSDYANSGYDRGHMCPSAAMAYDIDRMTDTYSIANIAPQDSHMNENIWGHLEGKTRDWAIDRGEVFVITGNVFKDGKTLGQIGKRHFADVPTHLYKILFDPKEEDAMAFMIPNVEEKTEDYSKFLTSIDEIEKDTGLDFFSEVDMSATALKKLKSTKTKLWK
eukprot:GFYU01005865.1.p1 GENE.GFYU01005865.1~~GFYU01005865.1.p1  ORF type:complete len:327 (-),score=102.33 GFYU01005865.1:75-1055(-)